ncbi:MAG: SAGA HAT/Core module component [Pycnora praestabilis]|nr:MAG: SAGA HAT/Core module component [Pycnora praestabilis]
MSNFHNDKRELGKQKREYQGEIQAPRRKHLQARLDKIINYNQNERDFEDYRHETENNEYLPKLHADSGDKRGNEAAEVNEDKAEKKRQRDDTAEPESKKNKCEEETLASDEPDQGYDLPSWVDEVNPKRLSATVLHGYNAFKYMVGETGDSELAQEVSVMAARSRPRNGVVKEDPPDAHEERNMWSSITGDLTKVKSINARAAEVSKAIIEKEKYMHTNFASKSMQSLLRNTLVNISFATKSCNSALNNPSLQLVHHCPLPQIPIMSLQMWLDWLFATVYCCNLVLGFTTAYVCILVFPLFMWIRIIAFVACVRFTILYIYTNLRYEFFDSDTNLKIDLFIWNYVPQIVWAFFDPQRLMSMKRLRDTLRNLSDFVLALWLALFVSVFLDVVVFFCPQMGTSFAPLFYTLIDISKTSYRRLMSPHISPHHTLEQLYGSNTPVPLAMQDIDELQAMYRENVKLAAEEQKILNEGPEEVISNIEILKALRNASEIDPTRSGTNAKSRGPKRHPDVASASAESPAPSPNTVSSSAARFKDKVSRSGSVSSLKDNKESLSSSAKLDDMIDGAKGTSAERAGHLFVGAEVAFKQSKQKGQEGDWIQCTILTVTGDTKKRYEVQDPEPDDTGAPGQIYKTSAAALIPIPAAGSPLPEFPKGKQVLARYPETTTFYRAEVVSLRKDVCRLRFEDEDDKDKEMDVDRRYVLDMGGK